MVDPPGALMPDFEITAPDGRKFIVTAPDGATQDEVLAYAQKQHGSAKAPEPSLGERFTRGLGLGTRDAIEGVGQLPGMAYDALMFPGKTIARGINAIAGTDIPIAPSSSELLPKVGEALGLPTPETRGERLRSDVGRNVASMIPSMGTGAVLAGGKGAIGTIGQALTAAPVSQVAGAAGSGLAGGAARESDASPAQQFGAALAGGVAGAVLPTVASMAGRGISALAQPFSDAGRRKIVGEALLRNSSDPETLAARLTAGADDGARRLPGSPVTSGVAARDPQMLLLESGLRSDAQTAPGVMSPATAIRDVEAQRNAVRLATAEALQRGKAPNVTARGDAVRAGLDAAEGGMKARTNQLFDIARDRSTTQVPAGNIMGRVGGALSIFDPKRGGPGVPPELQGVLDDIGKLGTLNVDQAQNIRSRLGEIAGQASVAGNKRLSSAAGAVSNAIEEEMSDPRWMAAVAQRRAMGEALGRDSAGVAATGAILRTDKFGAPMITSDVAIKKAIETPQAARQVLEAGYKALDDARAARMPTEELTASIKTMRQAMRDQFAENMTGASRTTSDIADAAGNISRQLSPAQFTRWWEKNKAVADVLFDGAERKVLDKLVADFAETSVVNTARARGSDTAQNLSVGNFIARLTNGAIDPQNPLAQSLGNLGPIAGWITRAPEQAMREMLVHAIGDPKFAAQLVQDAGPQSLQRAMLYFQQTMPERLRDAVVGASAREIPRVGLAIPTPSPKQLPGPMGR